MMRDWFDEKRKSHAPTRRDLVEFEKREIDQRYFWVFAILSLSIIVSVIAISVWILCGVSNACIVFAGSLCAAATALALSFICYKAALYIWASIKVRSDFPENSHKSKLSFKQIIKFGNQNGSR